MVPMVSALERFHCITIRCCYCSLHSLFLLSVVVQVSREWLLLIPSWKTSLYVYVLSLTAQSVSPKRYCLWFLQWVKFLTRNSLVSLRKSTPWALLLSWGLPVYPWGQICLSLWCKECSWYIVSTFVTRVGGGLTVFSKPSCRWGLEICQNVRGGWA